MITASGKSHKFYRNLYNLASRYLFASFAVFDLIPLL